MPLDAYSPCPCGSGKKFKWCCQPIHVQINRAFEQDHAGQHDAARKIMDEVVAANPANPEALGRKAQLLYENDRVDEAEATLQRALEIAPRYPFGHLLQGMFRLGEGEHRGALALFRKAAEYYDPEARDVLGEVYARIGECEFRLNRPLAARAAFRLAVRWLPAQEDLRRNLEEVFGEKSRLPLSARRDYSLQGPAAGIAENLRQRWTRALAGTDEGRLLDAGRAFEQLVQDVPDDPAAWYNLGLVRAWLGENGPALEALDRYVNLEEDTDRAAGAWALGSVLRQGVGMEEQADSLTHSVTYLVQDFDRLGNFLDRLQKEGRFRAMASDPKIGMLTGLILPRMPDLTPELRNVQVAPLGAYLLIAGPALRLWHTSASRLAEARSELESSLAPTLADAKVEDECSAFPDMSAEALAFAKPGARPEDVRPRIQAHIERYFEETWLRRAFPSLNQIPPIDAAGHPVLRKKLLGVIQFLEEVWKSEDGIEYDFERLRRKLGLAAQSSKTDAGVATPGVDPSAMGAAELAALPVDDLGSEALEQAFQASLRLDARDLARRFAERLVARPLREGRADRFAWYSHLLQSAIDEGDMDHALELVDQGEKADCEENEGRRRNDYELKRGQVLAKHGNLDQAVDVFHRLIERAPSESRYYGVAAEALLSARQAQKALDFAEKGLGAARQRQDRDSEEYFKELAAAARKQM